jgi:hypothetical protein
MMDKIIHWAALIVALVLMILGFWLRDLSAHENEEYKHQTERLVRYGQGDGDLFQQVIFINPENTMCVDAIFAHGMMHLTEPYACRVINHGN